MPSQRPWSRQLRLVREGGSEPIASRPRGRAAAAGGVAAALVAMACAFGQTPDQPTARDAPADEAGLESPRNAIDNFLSDSRRYLGL